MSTRTFRRIELYRMRTFNDKFSDTFSWLREHWKPLLIFMTYFLLPLAIVNAFFMPDVLSPNIDVYSDELPVSFLTSVGCYLLFTFVAQLLCYSITYAMLRMYFFAPASLETLSVHTFWPEMRHCLWRAFKISLLVFGVVLLAMGLYIGLAILIGATLGFVVILMVPVLFLLIVAALPLMLVMPRTLLTDDDMIPSFTNGYHLGWNTLGGVILIALIITIITNIITSVCGIPVMMISMLKGFNNAGIGDFEFLHSPVFIFVEFLCNILYGFVTFCFSAVLHVAMAFQYGHAAEKIDGITSAQNLKSFESL